MRHGQATGRRVRRFILEIFLYCCQPQIHFVTRKEQYPMSNPEDDVIISLRTSFTKDEAVAKLLGWMQGPITKRVINVTEHGIPENQLPELSSLHGSLQNTLNEVLQAARAELIDAAEEGAPDDVLKEKEEAVERCKEYSQKAHEYLLDIDDELSKGRDSLIRIDQFETERTGIPHLTLKSLDKWAKEQYGISLLDDSSEPGHNKDEAKEQQSEEVNENNRKGGLSRTKADNLLTTFALLVEGFSEQASGFRVNERPNVSQIAKRLEELATKANNGENLKGQGHEAIRDRINEALDVKRSKLPEK